VASAFQTRNNKIKLLMEYESVTQNVLFGNAILAALMSGRTYVVIPLKWRLFKRKQCVYLGFLKQSLLSKLNVVTELNMEKIHLQMMLTLTKAISRGW
jgi:hypothetical protein